MPTDEDNIPDLSSHTELVSFYGNTNLYGSTTNIGGADLNVNSTSVRISSQNASITTTSRLVVHGGVDIEDNSIDLYRNGQREGGVVFFDEITNSLKAYDDMGIIHNLIFNPNTGSFTLEGHEHVEDVEPQTFTEDIDPIEDRSEILDI